MIQRNAAYYDLVRQALKGATYQEFVDTMFADKYNAPSTEGFMWDDDIQNDFTYHQLEVEMGVHAMATFVDIDSPAPLRSVSGIEVATGKIPRMKHGFNLNEKIIREQMLMAQYGVFSSATEESIMKLLYNTTEQLIKGNYNSLSYQRHQAISTGKLILTDVNNPMGIQNVTFDFKIPDANITTLAGNYRWWTDSAYTTEGSSATPVEDLMAVVQKAEDAFAPIGAFETSKAMFRRFMAHSKVKISIGYLYNPDAGSDVAAAALAGRLSLEEVRGILERKLATPVRIIDHKGVVEKYNKATKKVDKTNISSFDEDVWVLVPEGELGTIKAVKPLVVPDPAARIAFYDGGRTVLKQTFNTDMNTQSVWSEMTALCVPNKRNYMYYLNVK